MATREQILDVALRLPGDHRAFIAAKLIESLDSETFADDVAEEWHAEIRRRLERAVSGEVTGRPWEEVSAEITSRLQTFRNSRPSS